MSDDKEGTWSWADARGQVKRAEDVVSICVDGSVRVRLKAARAAMMATLRESAGTLAEPDVAAMRAEVEKIEKEQRDATLDFTVHAIPHVQWRELLVAHPSKERGWRYDAETFVPAAIAACCPHFKDADEVEAASSDEEHGLTKEQVTDLFQAIWRLNEGEDRTPFLPTV